MIHCQLATLVSHCKSALFAPNPSAVLRSHERDVAFHYCRAIKCHARIVRIAKRMAKRRAL